MLDVRASADNDIQVILTHYPVPHELRQRLELLIEVRHEIIQPAHQPGPEPNNTLAYSRVPAQIQTMSGSIS